MNPSRPCPACGAIDARDLMHRHEFARIDGVSVVDGYDVVCCRRCGMTFADRIPDQATFDRYYREASKYTSVQRDGAESPADATRLALTAADLAAQVADRSLRILDVGCATGRLAVELRARGFTNVAGIDPSPDAINAARRIHGVEAEVGTLAEAADAGRMADLVILVGVLEHLSDLDSTAAALRAIVQPGGRLYVEVPDVGGFADWPNAPYQELSTEHVNFFSVASLRAALARLGFTLTWHERLTRYQTPATRVATIAAIASRDSASVNVRSVVSDAGSCAAMQRYLERSARGEALVRERLRAIALEHSRVVVWGAGTLALRLVAAGAFAPFELAAFADSNARYQNRTIRGVPIVPPSRLHELRLPVILASWGFRSEMADQLVNTGSHKVTTLPVFNDELSKILSTN